MNSTFTWDRTRSVGLVGRNPLDVFHVIPPIKLVACPTNQPTAETLRISLAALPKDELSADLSHAVQAGVGGAQAVSF